MFCCPTRWQPMEVFRRNCEEQNLMGIPFLILMPWQPFASCFHLTKTISGIIKPPMENLLKKELNIYGASSCLPGRRPQGLAAGGAALRRALAAQLGARRFHRSRRAARARRRARLRAGVGLNPLHALFTTAPSTGSPYAPNSRLFLNPLYIDVEAIEECPPRLRSRRTPRDRALAREPSWSTTPRSRELKFPRCAPPIGRSAQGGSAERRARFRRLSRRARRGARTLCGLRDAARTLSGPWQEWPAAWRRPSDAALRRAARDATPTTSASTNSCNGTPSASSSAAATSRGARGLPVGLYLDTAVGVDPAGADAWMRPGRDAARSVGRRAARPFNPAGQDWGITHTIRTGLRRATSSRSAQMLRAAMRHAGAIRHRSRARPDAAVRHSARAGRAATAPICGCRSKRMLSVVAEESRRWRCIVIGEDLGTVPEGFRENARGLGRVVVSGDAVRARPRRRVPRAAALSASARSRPSTPTTLRLSRAGCAGTILRVKRGIGLDPGETDAERQAARAELALGGRRGDAQRHPGFRRGVARSSRRRRAGWSRSRSRTCWA